MAPPRLALTLTLITLATEARGDWFQTGNVLWHTAPNGSRSYIYVNPPSGPSSSPFVSSPAPTWQGPSMPAGPPSGPPPPPGLRELAWKGDVAAVRRLLLARGKNVGQQDEIYAAEEAGKASQSQVVRAFVESWLQHRPVAGLREPLLHALGHSVRYGDGPTAERLLKAGLDPNYAFTVMVRRIGPIRDCKDRMYGDLGRKMHAQPLVLLAIGNANERMASLLVRAGADPERPNGCGETIEDYVASQRPKNPQFADHIQNAGDTARLELAARLEAAPPGKRDLPRAETIYRTVCERGRPIACVRLGALLADRDAVAAAPHFERHCPAVAEACGWLGEQALEGKGRPKDLAKAKAAFDQGCAGKDGYSCRRRGALAQADRDLPGMLRGFEAACTHGDGVGCFLAADHLARGDGAPADPKRAADLAEKACNWGEPIACAGLAERLQLGQGRPKDPVRAKSLAEGACQIGEGYGCAVEGFVRLETGDGLGAIPPFTKGCELGTPLACAGLGRLYEEGKAVAKELPKALGFYLQACERRYGTACAAAARMTAAGQGRKRDGKEAAKLKARACELGDRASCGRR